MEHTGTLIGCNVIQLDTVDSTNRYVRRLGLQGAGEGLAVLSREQTAGRGRRGRSFQSTAGLGLYLSVLVRPKISVHQLPQLTAWTAVAVCDGVEAACGVRPQIKWVNDLILNGKKLGGILTELEPGSGTGDGFAVIGVGINAAHRREDFLPELRDTATSLAAEGLCVQTEVLAKHLLAALDRMYACFPDGREEYLSRYRADCLTTGNFVKLITPDGERDGEAVGIDDAFRLLVRRPDGAVEAVDTGEASVRGLCGYV